MENINDDLAADFNRFNHEREVNKAMTSFNNNLTDEETLKVQRILSARELQYNDGKVVSAKRQQKITKQVSNISQSLKILAITLGTVIVIGGVTSTISLKRDLNLYNDYCEKNNLPQKDFISFVVNGPDYILKRVKVGDKTYLFANEKDAHMFEEACVVDNYEIGIPASEENIENYYENYIDTFYDYLQQDDDNKNRDGFINYKYSESNKNIRG